jgi:uncharacterized FlaG/YvyC family protein
MAVVTVENGIEIHCDDSGKFSAYGYGQRFEDRSLSKVKKWTATIKPSVELMQIDTDRDRYRTARGFRLISNIIEVKHNSKEELVGYGPSNATTSRSRYGSYQPSYDRLFVPDKAVQDAIKAINEQLEIWEQEVRTRYNDAYDEIVAKLEPITEEKFAELVKQAAQSKP